MGHLAHWDGESRPMVDARKNSRRREADHEHMTRSTRHASAQRKASQLDEILAEVMANQERLIPLLLDRGKLMIYRIYMYWREHGRTD